MSGNIDQSPAAVALSRWATWREIHAQPDAWLQLLSKHDIAALRHWIADQNTNEVWFCGAGSSAYLGDILVAGLRTSVRFRSVPSTDLVSAPQRFLSNLSATGVKPLIVNFGRSGNSAESIGTMDALDALLPEAPRLNITCNPGGALATRSSTGASKVVLMPDAAIDTGFAMTCSFSTMLITALALFDEPVDIETRFTTMAQQARQLMPNVTNRLLADSFPMPQRSVFIGAGELTFVAREAALKVLELTAGGIASLWDSTLGFRHGPKSFVTEQSVIWVYLSPESPANQYDDDVVTELRKQFPKTNVQTIGSGGDIDIPMPYGSLWATPVCAIVAQLAAVIWADALGHPVDDPFEGLGTLTKVVADVTLYPVAS